MKMKDITRKFFSRLFQCILALVVVVSFPTLAEDTKTITISAVGDCTLGRNYKMDYENSWDDCFDRYGAEYFLKNVNDVFQKDNITIANLEGVLSYSAPRQEIFYRQKHGMIDDKAYCHLGKPEYLNALVLGGVDAVSFANNHNIDYGLQGFEDTLDACDACHLPVAYYDTVARLTVSGITVGIVSIDSTYCSLDVAEGYLRGGIADLRVDCDLIVCCMHWGKNYKTKPNDEQRYLGHLCIDLGADLVIGTHAHILQGVERYKGRYIFYSLGNFTYGGRAVPKDVDTIVAQQTFSFVDGKLKVDDNVTIIPCWMSTRTDINDFCPIVKDGTVGHEIIEKVNEYSEEFGIVFDEEGHPAIEPAADTERVPRNAVPYEAKPPRVPTIINELLQIPEHFG